MKDRSYTVAEIHRMRAAVECKWLFGMKTSERHALGSATSRTYKEEEKTKCVEELLRTYMQAGVDPKELE